VSSSPRTAPASAAASSPAAASRPDPNLPAGVVFDCDGTIADTESLSDRAWTELLTAAGYTPTAADFQAVIGHPWRQNWSYFAARARLGDEDAFRARLRARFRELVDTDLAVHDDAVDTLRALAVAGVPIGVASSSTHAHVDRVLAHAGVTDLVGAVVGADDVTRHKPDPTPYLVAAAAIGVDPDRCSAVEDTPVGIRSAVDAGMFTVGVVRAHGDPAALQAADRVVDVVDVAALLADPRDPDRGRAHR
jgi:HAD superfamily hydrolase (TIGR01509 family)